MHFQMALVAVILVLFTVTLADNCNSETLFELEGNVYCTAVDAIRYENFGTPGTYGQIIDMNPDGKCPSIPKEFGGPLAPLDEEVSLHFRGPLHLKQLAVYKLNGLPHRRLSNPLSRVHGHQRSHKRYVGPEAVKEPMKNDLADDNVEGRGKIVHEALDGVLYTLIDFWYNSGENPNSLAITSTAQVTASRVAQPSATFSVISTPGATAGGFTRTGYYNSASEHLDGLTFLGNHGGDGSGVFDEVYGASLSYLSADGTRGASSPKTLTDSIIGSATEYTIMTDEVCNGNCGFVRPGSVAYHGFEGADKVFLMEFQMPLDGNTGFQGDTPAIWMLNAQIPRTLQYGNENCSCWQSGCGELDIVEVLSSGLIQCKSTIHTNTPAGDSDYILRPTDSPMKLAVVFRSASSTAHIQVLDGSFDFGASLSSAQIDKICTTTKGSLLSVFDITA